MNSLCSSCFVTTTLPSLPAGVPAVVAVALGLSATPAWRCWEARLFAASLAVCQGPRRGQSAHLAALHHTKTNCDKLCTRLTQRAIASVKLRDCGNTLLRVIGHQMVWSLQSRTLGQGDRPNPNILSMPFISFPFVALNCLPVDPRTRLFTASQDCNQHQPSTPPLSPGRRELQHQPKLQYHEYHVSCARYLCFQ